METVRPTSCSSQKIPIPQAVEPLDPTSAWLSVSFGQTTFDAEGLEAPGRFFSRALHWPGGASGVTIGRGYDMGWRSSTQIQSELSRAGLDPAGVELLARAAGLRGAAASRFFEQERSAAPILPLETQHALFEQVTMPETIRDIERILTKPDVVSTYGAVSWPELPNAAQELLFDLRYRGDYTPATREFLQPLLVAKDWSGLADAVENEALWRGRGVPEGRIAARAEIAQELRQVSPGAPSGS